MTRVKVAEAAGISSDAVRAKTGKGWTEWFAVLDRAGAVDWPHREIAKHLYEKCGCPGWWSQMVTVGYEQERGLRVKYQKCDGAFSANASKTIAVPIGALFNAWNDPKSRTKWLPEGTKMVIRKATVNKALRITWADGDTKVDVNFLAKGPAKSMVAVQHDRLAGVNDVVRRKAFWTAALAKLQAMLEATAGKQRTAARPARRKSPSMNKRAP